ncbi:MAG: fluoride efflux transporter CrcB [Eubacteriaceae bacterium]
MFNVIAVGLGGFFGAILRYLISSYTTRINAAFPYGTLIVNILGGFLIGLILQLSFDNFEISPTLRMFLTTGLLGGLTTFSTFSYETVGMFVDNNIYIGAINIFLNVTLSLTGVFLGKYIAQII